MKYPLCVSTWGEEEKAVIAKVVESGKLTMGDRVKQFEHEFAEYHNVKYAVMANSGSSANLLGASALKYCNNIIEKDEIIVPAVGWSTTYFPFHQLGYTLVFVDVDENLCINPLKIREKITKRTKAICAINLLGFPCSYFPEINDICNEHNIMYIEDNCEGLGAIPCGTLGIYGTFSFFFSHHIQTIEGGMLITEDRDLYRAALALRAHGWTRDLPGGNKEDWVFVLPGYNLRPSEINGALGSCQLSKLDIFLAQRRKNALVYQDIFGKEEYCKIFYPQSHASWFAFPFILQGKLRDKRQLVLDKFREYNIETRPIISGNFVNQPVMAKLRCDYKYTKMNMADEIGEYGFMIGNNHTNLTEQLYYTKEVFEKCL